MIRMMLVTLAACSGDLEVDDPTLEPPDAPNAPTVQFVSPEEGTELDADASLRIEVTVTDTDSPDLQTITLAWSGTYADEAPMNPDSSGRLVFFPANVQPGNVSLTVTATDVDGLTATDAVSFTVLPPPVDDDNDGFFSDVDCNDQDETINPGAAEICDGIDQDCDDEVDEGVTTTFYPDTDGDTFGDPNAAIEACSLPPDHVLDNTDCNDSSDAIFPGAMEVCDGIDQDCDTQIDEGLTTTFYADNDGDSFGDPQTTMAACTPPAGFVIDASDCDDMQMSVFPGAPEVCNNLDDNCDAQVDEGVTTTFYRDMDGDGFGNRLVTTQACAVPNGYATTPDDCDDQDATVTTGQVLSRFPGDGTFDAPRTSTIRAELDSADPNALLSLTGPTGAVPGVTSLVGTNRRILAERPPRRASHNTRRN